MRPKIEYMGNYLEMTDFCHNIDDEKNGNPYNCSFDIKVRAGLFSGFADGCECDYKELKRFIQALEDMLLFKINEVNFVEICFGNKLSFKCDKTGHINVSGELKDSEGCCCLKFEFMTDQTVFPDFINTLKLL